MTLAPPIAVSPGSCACSLDGNACACMPADAEALMRALSDAKYRSDAATDDAERAHWTAERSRIATQLNKAMEYRADGHNEPREGNRTMTPKEREDLIAKAAEARKRAGLPFVAIRVDDSDAYVAALCKSTLDLVAQCEAANRGTRTLSSERRDELIKSAVQIRLDCGDPDSATALERDLRDASDAYLQARVTGELERGRQQLAWQAQRRADDARRNAEAVTEADIAQAEHDLQAMRLDSRYASPHAKHDEQGFRRAVEMRASSIARQRVAREDALRRPVERTERVEAFDPISDGVGGWASPHDTKKGR